MIYGDPFSFALQFDVVGSWNTPDNIWQNGIFSLYIDGDRVFNVVDAFELRTEFSFYAGFPVEQFTVNDENIDAESLCNNAKDYFYGDGEELIDGLVDMTCTPMGDHGYGLYYLKTSAGDRIILELDGGLVTKEFLLPSGTIKSLIERMRSHPLFIFNVDGLT